MEQQVFAFIDTSPSTVGALQEDVLAAVAAGRAAVVDLDPLPLLDNGALRGLILILRRVREAGGILLIQVTKPELLHTLRLTALDRVFRLTGEVSGALAC